MMIMDRFSPIRLSKQANALVGRFSAMGSPCEVMVNTDDLELAKDMARIASEEAWRIERKFSRYKEENVVDQINRAGGKPVQVDEETAHLLDFASEAHRLSGGLFDVTSGVLRKAWRFDGGRGLPSPEEVRGFLPKVGWHKVKWNRPVLQLLPGMEIDLGGVGKEYAVDRAGQLLRGRSPAGFLVNFGGDIVAGGRKRNGAPWFVGIEDVHADGRAAKTLRVNGGALATSGDSKKYIQADGRRYGHILDPRSGWPVEEPPRSVTVAADSCTEAGFLSTVAILNGKNAESFLKGMGARYWCYWN